MLNRTLQNDEIMQAFAVLSTAISNRSQNSMLDDNRVMETILPDLLNGLYGYALRDLNLIKHNYPAIDLGDTFRGIAVQITSDGSKSKMVDTITMLEKHGLNTTYHTIIFLIISNDQKISYQNSKYNIKIINLGNISKDICGLPFNKFEPVYQFCKSQFSSYFHKVAQSQFKPKIIPSKDPSLNIDKFLAANGVDLSDSFYKITANDVRNDLIEIKNLLSQLNDDQRWFIHKVMTWSIHYNSKDVWEYCIVPRSHMTTGSDPYKVRETFESLESLNLAYHETEGTWKFDYPFYAIYFKGQLEESNYFGSICVFLMESNQIERLGDIIVHCDFSSIN
ncbi:SMEK domain-containing protein [Serratia liquefaciens]|uniref:SMEK domain-containing protein n=1 Tax=Serratia liquefaciens TaxID=614 RepID=UPI0021C68328|nr:SMEK domain-containing protein [Serratia liquefaciens]